MALSRTYLIFLPALGLVAFLVSHLSVKIIMIFFLLSTTVSSTKNNTAERIKPENIYKKQDLYQYCGKKLAPIIQDFIIKGMGGGWRMLSSDTVWPTTVTTLV